VLAGIAEYLDEEIGHAVGNLEMILEVGHSPMVTVRKLLKTPRYRRSPNGSVSACAIWARNGYRGRHHSRARECPPAALIKPGTPSIDPSTRATARSAGRQALQPDS
jgi:hypothetical protein